MRALTNLLTLGLAATQVMAWNSATKFAYNKWHETELERWLSDHSIPYPAPADRKDLESLVEKNWKTYVVEPFTNWDTPQLSAYLQAKGKEVEKEAQSSKDSLVSQVRSNWYETEDNASQAYVSVKDWILDTWTESQLKAFCDKNKIPVPQPRARDTVLQKARSSYEMAAKKISETAAYPGDWLWASWSESDLKEWLDLHGVPAPQASSRDKLVASVRRNSRLAYLKAQDQAASATASAKATYATLTDMIIDAWSESQLKEFCDKNGIAVPQGTKTNELRALVRKHRADILADNVAGKASKAFGAATSNAQNQYAKATDSAALAAQDAFNQAVNYWSETRLKSYLDARGVPVPQGSSKNELQALARKHAHKAASGWDVWTFDEFTYDNLRKYLEKNGDAAAKKAAKKKDATREDLVSAVQSAYSSASKAGGTQYASATSYISAATDAAKAGAFEAWTDTELKAYLDSYGVKVPQGSKLEELKALARKQSTYFRYGTTTPAQTVFAQIADNAKSGLSWIASQLKLGGQAAQDKAAEVEAEAKAQAKKAKAEL